MSRRPISEFLIGKKDLLKLSAEILRDVLNLEFLEFVRNQRNLVC